MENLFKGLVKLLAKIALVLVAALSLWGYWSIFNYAAADTLYAKVGAGYKLVELSIYDPEKGEDINASDTALFEIGVRSGDLTYGIRHVSNWSEGEPFNNNDEYNKDELFIEYSFDIMEF